MEFVSVTVESTSPHISKKLIITVIPTGHNKIEKQHKTEIKRNINTKHLIRWSYQIMLQKSSGCSNRSKKFHVISTTVNLDEIYYYFWCWWWRDDISWLNVWCQQPGQVSIETFIWIHLITLHFHWLQNTWYPPGTWNNVITKITFIHKNKQKRRKLMRSRLQGPQWKLQRRCGEFI